MLWSNDNTGGEPVLLTGRDLTLRDFVRVTEQHVPVVLDGAVKDRMEQGHALLGRYLAEGRRIYGVSTDYGARSATAVAAEGRLRMQRNTVLSHTCGTGPDLAGEIVRGMLLLKANTLATGLSGVRFALVETLIAWLNRGLSPCVPSQGSVGASGDLVPSAHLGSALLGYGRVHYQGHEWTAREALSAAGLQPFELDEKEGLSLVNGTVLMCSYAASNVARALLLLETADVVAATSLQALGGYTRGIRRRPGGRASALRGNGLCGAYARSVCRLAGDSPPRQHARTRPLLIPLPAPGAWGGTRRGGLCPHDSGDRIERRGR